MTKYITSQRIESAKKNGFMQHRGYRMKRWEDGIWHIYSPGTSNCIGEELYISDAINVINNDILHVNVKEVTDERP